MAHPLSATERTPSSAVRDFQCCETAGTWKETFLSITFPTLGSLFQLSVFTFDFGQSYPCCYLTAACAIGQKLSISKRSASGVLCSISSLLQVPLAKSAAGYVQGKCTSDIFRWIMMDSCPTSSFDQFRGLLCASVHCPTRHVAHLSLPGWMPSWSDWSLQCRSSHVTYARTQRYQDTDFMHYDGIFWDSTSILIILESMMHGLHRCWVPGVQEWRRKERQKGKVSTLGP